MFEHLSDKLLENLERLMDRYPQVLFCRTQSHHAAFSKHPHGRKPESLQPGSEIMSMLKSVYRVLDFDLGTSIDAL